MGKLQVNQKSHRQYRKYSKTDISLEPAIHYVYQCLNSQGMLLKKCFDFKAQQTNNLAEIYQHYKCYTI